MELDYDAAGDLSMLVESGGGDLITVPTGTRRKTTDVSIDIVVDYVQLKASGTCEFVAGDKVSKPAGAFDCHRFRRC